MATMASDRSAGRLPAGPALGWTSGGSADALTAAAPPPESPRTPATASPHPAIAISATISSGTPSITAGYESQARTVTATARAAARGRSASCDGRRDGTRTPTAPRRQSSEGSPIQATVTLAAGIADELRIEPLERLGRDGSAINQPRVALQPHVLGVRRRAASNDTSSVIPLRVSTDTGDFTLPNSALVTAEATTPEPQDSVSALHAALVGPHLDRMLVAHDHEVHVRAAVRLQIGMPADRAAERRDVLRPEIVAQEDHVVRHADHDRAAAHASDRRPPAAAAARNACGGGSESVTCPPSPISALTIPASVSMVIFRPAITFRNANRAAQRVPLPQNVAERAVGVVVAHAERGPGRAFDEDEPVGADRERAGADPPRQLARRRRSCAARLSMTTKSFPPPAIFEKGERILFARLHLRRVSIGIFTPEVSPPAVLYSRTDARHASRNVDANVATVASLRVAQRDLRACDLRLSGGQSLKRTLALIAALASPLPLLAQSKTAGARAAAARREHRRPRSSTSTSSSPTSAAIRSPA